MFLYNEREPKWFRNKLDLITPLSLFPTVAGIANASWKLEPEKIVIVQGSARFCRKIVEGLVSIGVNDSTRIIITSNDKCRNLKLSFKFLCLDHHRLGGASETISSIGFSKACGIQDKMVFSKGIPSAVLDHICPLQSGAVFDPIHDANVTGATRFLSGDCARPIKVMLESEFILPSLFSKTNWVHRYLSDSELLSILDVPVQVTKWIDEKDKINLRDQGELLNKVVPLKVLQEVTRILFGWAPPIERSHIIPIYDVNRLGLKLEGLEFIY